MCWLPRFPFERMGPPFCLGSGLDDVDGQSSSTSSLHAYQHVNGSSIIILDEDHEAEPAKKRRSKTGCGTCKSEWMASWPSLRLEGGGPRRLSPLSDSSSPAFSLPPRRSPFESSCPYLAASFRPDLDAYRPSPSFLCFALIALPHSARRKK